MMKLTKDTNILIIGLGVIGGGYAKALSKQGFRVCCITKDRDDIDYALKKGMIAEGSTEPTAEFVGKADLIICALYPTTFIEWVTAHQHLFKSGAVLTDVTGVKGKIVRKVQSLLREDVEFISAHPMAGREQKGVLFSDDAIFCGANYIVTPTEKNTPEAIALCRELGAKLGFGRITELSIEEHDKMIAFLSQLTHCIAITLMTCNENPNLEAYTGDSFRDLTRIAKINDEMWSELFMLNREALLAEMGRFSAEFARFQIMLAEGNREGMREKMRLSTERRSRFDKKA